MRLTDYLIKNNEFIGRTPISELQGKGIQPIEYYENIIFEESGMREVYQDILNNLSLDYIKNIVEFPLTALEMDNIRIIGVTGSVGKTTMCIAMYDYLTKLGKRVTMMSSAYRVNPLMYNTNNHTSYSMGIANKFDIVNFIKNSIDYKAEYIILEFTSLSAFKKLHEDIPFTIKLITNMKDELFYRNVIDEVGETSYEQILNSKLDFAKSDENCTLFLSTEMSEENYSRFYKTSLNVEVFGTPSTPIVKNYILKEALLSLDGSRFVYDLKGRSFVIEEKTIFNHNAINCLMLLSIFSYLNVLNDKTFLAFYKEWEPSGRTELYNINNRTIVIDISIETNLKLEKFKGGVNLDTPYHKLDDPIFKYVKTDANLISVHNITFSKIVAMYKKKMIGNERIIQALKWITTCLKNVDKAYFNILPPVYRKFVKDIVIEENKLLQDKLTILPTRYEVIEMALTNSTEGDIILITGTGTNPAVANERGEIIINKDDRTIVFEIAEKLGWLL